MAALPPARGAGRGGGDEILIVDKKITSVFGDWNIDWILCILFFWYIYFGHGASLLTHIINSRLLSFWNS